jgi:hypothetical protein
MPAEPINITFNKDNMPVGELKKCADILETITWTFKRVRNEANLDEAREAVTNYIEMIAPELTTWQERN